MFVDTRVNPKNMREINLILVDRQLQYMRNRLRHTKNNSFVMIPNVSTIHVEDKGYFSKIGVSQPHDLLSRNFGEIVKGIFAAQQTVSTMYNTAGVQKDCLLKGDGTNSIWDALATGVPYVRLGSGSTLVTRTDNTVETSLVTAPENADTVFTSNAGYADGVISFMESIGPFGATETVRESAIIIAGREYATLTTQKYTFARYNYTPLSVTIAETAVISTTINI